MDGIEYKQLKNKRKIPIKAGIQLARANKILRDVDKDFNYKLKVSGIINDWAQDQIDK